MAAARAAVAQELARAEAALTSEKEKLGRLKREAIELATAHDAAVEELSQERKRRVELSAELEEARTARDQAAQQAAKLQQSQEQYLEVQKGAGASGGLKFAAGAPATVPEAAAQAIFGDLEMGRSGVTLGELGLGDLQGLHCLDRALQGIAVLMAWRSDMRLAVFGLWLLCHLIYMLNMVYSRVF
uniref:Uncharacterized protein n=1 Tax=Zooxanthella nutricula TaxID=1333877 RepID=A0A7S2QD29_9DINO